MAFSCKARLAARRARESRAVCVNWCVRACVFWCYLWRNPLFGLQESGERRKEEEEEEDRRRGGGGGGRRADLSTSPHCGTRGAATGDSEPTLILDSETHAQTLTFLSPLIAPHFQWTASDIWKERNSLHPLGRGGRGRSGSQNHSCVDISVGGGWWRRSGWINLTTETRFWFPLLSRAPEWSNRLQCHLHLAAWRDVSREWGELNSPVFGSHFVCAP